MTQTRDGGDIAAVIQRMVAERGTAKTVCPSEVARAIAGADEKAWRLLMKPIRAVAVRLAAAGRISIRRKGQVVDPADFKGIYRLAPPPDEAADGTGSDGAGRSALVRPESR